MRKRSEKEALEIVTQVTGDKYPEFLGTKNPGGGGHYVHVIEACLDHDGDYIDVSKFYIPWDIEFPDWMYGGMVHPQWSRSEIGPTLKKIKRVLEIARQGAKSSF